MDKLNDKPFEHHCRNGTTFKCSRCDFRDVINVSNPDNPTTEKLMKDVAEMIGYHAFNIWEQLNGFSGYDAVRFNFASDIDVGSK